MKHLFPLPYLWPIASAFYIYHTFNQDQYTLLLQDVAIAIAMDWAPLALNDQKKLSV